MPSAAAPALVAAAVPAIAACTEVSPWRFPSRRLARCLARRLASWKAWRRDGRTLRLLLDLILGLLESLRLCGGLRLLGILGDLITEANPGEGWVGYH